MNACLPRCGVNWLSLCAPIGSSVATASRRLKLPGFLCLRLLGRTCSAARSLLHVQKKILKLEGAPEWTLRLASICNVMWEKWVLYKEGVGTWSGAGPSSGPEITPPWQVVTTPSPNFPLPYGIQGHQSKHRIWMHSVVNSFSGGTNNQYIEK